MVAVTKLTSKGQTTIPQDVQAALHVVAGDLIAWEVADDGTARVRREQPMRRPFHPGVIPVQAGIQWSLGRGVPRSGRFKGGRAPRCSQRFVQGVLPAWNVRTGSPPARG